MAIVTIGNPNRWWNKPIPGTSWIDKGIGRTAKVGAIGAVVVGGIAALGIMANRSRAQAARDTRDEIANAPLDLPPVAIPQMMPPQPLEAGPAEGRAQGEWVNRVAPERAGIAAQQNPAAQPKMSVVPDSSVQDLGASTPAQPSR